MIYPGITFKGGLKISSKQSWNIFVFNCAYSFGDFSGRSIGRFRTKPFPRLLIIIGVPLRAIFIASTFLMAFNKGNVFWGNNAVIIINSFLIGISSGFMGVACGKNVPPRLNNQEKEQGGMIIPVMVNSGIAIGGLISLVAFQRLF